MYLLQLRNLFLKDLESITLKYKHQEGQNPFLPVFVREWEPNFLKHWLTNTDCPIQLTLGCYNKRPQTGWLIDNRKLFLTVLKPGKPMIKALADLQPCVKPLLVFQVAVVLYPHMVEREQDNFVVVFIMALVPFMRVPPSLPNYLPEAPPLISSLGGQDLNMGIWGGHNHSVHYNIPDCLSVLSLQYMPVFQRPLSLVLVS